MTAVAHFGRLAHLRASPHARQDALEIFENGALLLDARGCIVQAGGRSEILHAAPEALRVEHGDAWLLPGLVDGHIHFPQFYATAAAGRDLLDWLNRSIFPAELALRDPEMARGLAAAFVRRLLRAGTTTAAVFGSQFLPANEALFAEASDLGLRMIAGATLMDRGAPEALLQSPEQAYSQARHLIESHARHQRIRYAVTPRFALSCGEGMLEVCGALLREFPDCYLHTHLNESRGEIAAVKRDFPWARHYLDVYDRFGLLGGSTLLAHSIHTSDTELSRLAETGCAVCHCPSSNLYLGSGLFPLRSHWRRGLRVALGTDVGAGPNFSVWNVMSECYKVQQVQEHCLRVAELLFLATLGGAEALGVAAETGNFAAGKSGDFLVLDAGRDDYLQERLRHCESLEDQLFCLIHLSGPCHVAKTYVQGREIVA